MPETIYAGIWGDTYGDIEGGKLLVFQIKSNGLLEKIQTIDTGVGISTVIPTKDGRIVYAIAEMNEGLAEGIGGDILVFSAAQNDILKLVAIQSSRGAFPIDMVISERFVAIINHGSTTNKVLKTRKTESNLCEMYFEYDEASLTLFEMSEDGILKQFRDIYVFTGSGDVRPAQNSPSPHSINIQPDGNFIVVPERGTDQVSVFHIDNGSLKVVNCLKCRKNAGPRNIAFHPSKPVLYLIYEIEPLMGIYSYNVDGTEINLLDEISTVSEKYHNASGCPQLTSVPRPVAVVVDSAGEYLYVLTRVSNTITTYRIKPDGKLEMLDIKDVLGSHPRGLIFGEGHDCLYVSNLDNGNIVRFEIDKITHIPDHATVVAKQLGRIATINRRGLVDGENII